MHDRVTYNGLVLGDLSGNVINENDFRNITTTVNSTNGVITSVGTEPIAEVTIPCEWYGEYRYENSDDADQLIASAIAKFNSGNGAGELEINDWICDGLITGNQKSGYTKESIVTEYAFTKMSNWHKLRLTDGNQVDNVSHVPCNIRIEIDGPIAYASGNSAIRISGYPYGVRTAVNAGQKLVIDSKEKHIYILNSDGSEVDMYSLRVSTFTTFRKIPVGVNAGIYYDQAGRENTKVYIYDERMVPEW